MSKKVKVVKDSGERWLLTYADLMNLLLILFIILYTMSKVDVAKYEQVAQGLRSAFGDSAAATMIGVPGGGASLIQLDATAPSVVIPSKLEDEQMKALEKQVNELINTDKLKGTIDVSMEERGIVISIRAQTTFQSGSAVIEPGSIQILLDIGKELKSIHGNQIKIEGHTDTDPISTAQFPSNWELSSARATSVLRLLVDRSQIDPDIISAVGYGEFRPRVPNTTEENKAENRRVNIVIVRTAYDKAEAGMSENIDDTAVTSEQQNTTDKQVTN